MRGADPQTQSTIQIHALGLHVSTQFREYVTPERPLGLSKCEGEYVSQRERTSMPVHVGRARQSICLPTCIQTARANALTMGTG